MQQIVYVASPGSQQIHVFCLTSAGSLHLLQIVETTGQVQPLAISPDQRWLYAGMRPDFSVVSYKILADGRLRQQGSAPLLGSASHCSTDAKGKYFFAASYGFNHLTVSPITPEGIVQAPHQCIDKVTTAHCVALLTTQQGVEEVLVTSLKEDRIRRFILNEQGQLLPHALGDLYTQPQAGPRHLALHPHRDDVYVINELDGTVNYYQRDAADDLHYRQTLSILPEGYVGQCWAADIQITSDGRYLYTSERASSLLTLFAIDAEHGQLQLIDHFATEAVPRGFAIDHQNHYLIAAGQGSHHVALYEIDVASGHLQLLARYPVGNAPMWVRVVTLT